MAKELPYFKFYTSEWLDGDITLEDYETQGLFINLCSLYWSKEGNLFLNKMKKRFRILPEKCFNDLINEELITIDEDGKIQISFLNEQMEERDNLRQKNSINGKKGGRPKNPNKTQTKAIGLNSLTQTKANESNIEERRGEEKREEENKKLLKKADSDFKKESFDTFWNTYNKKEGRKKCFDKFIKLSKSEIEKILDVVKIYVSSTPDIKFRKNALTWLNGEHWNDEIEKKETKLTTANPKTKVDEVLQLFDESEFKAIEEKYKSNKSRIKDRLKEFLEVQQIKAGFKNRANDELLYHFINSIQYNPPVRVIKRSNEPVPWLTKDITGIVKPKY